MSDALLTFLFLFIELPFIGFVGYCFGIGFLSLVHKLKEKRKKNIKEGVEHD